MLTLAAVVGSRVIGYGVGAAATRLGCLAWAKHEMAAGS
jgi:hypothetical protein